MICAPMFLGVFLLVTLFECVRPVDQAALEKRQCPQRGCTDQEAEQAVLARQREFFEALGQCDIKRIVNQLIFEGANGMAIDRACTDGSCCVNTGPLESYWSHNVCNSHFARPEMSFSLVWLNNGTAVLTFNEVYASQFYPDEKGVLLGSTYYYSFYWESETEASCDYRLSYMRAYDANCPANTVKGCSTCGAKGKKTPFTRYRNY